MNNYIIYGNLLANKKQQNNDIFLQKNTLFCLPPNPQQNPKIVQKKFFNFINKNNKLTFIKKLSYELTTAQ